MEFMKGFTFEPFCSKGKFEKEDAYSSLLKMKEHTGANFVVFAPNGMQLTAQSEEIQFMNQYNVSDDELKRLMNYAKSIGLRIALKPTVNCVNQTWRAHINFFDKDVVCEPKWSNWFASYEQFQIHYAKIAQEMGCEIFIAGCEMVMSERREEEWRALIRRLRMVYHGLLSYNTDKYQEDNVKWWDELDIISSSGYYPINKWEDQLERIEQVVQHYNKPFFFAETGCMSVEGSSKIPNNWEIKGKYSEEEQALWYEDMFKQCLKKPWLKGIVLWDWKISVEPQTNCYDVQGKKAEKVVKKYFEESV